MTEVNTGYVTYGLTYGIDTYQAAKEYALNNKVLRPTVGAPMGFFEKQVIQVNKMLPVKPDEVAAAADKKVETLIEYGSETKDSAVAKLEVVRAAPGNLKQKAVVKIHDGFAKLLPAGVELESETVAPEERSVQMCFADAKEVLSSNVDSALTLSETKLQDIMPAKKEDEEIEAEGEETKTSKVVRITKVLGRRVRGRTSERVEEVKDKTKTLLSYDHYKATAITYTTFLSSKFGDVKMKVSTNLVDPTTKKVTVIVDNGKEVFTKYFEIVNDKLIEPVKGRVSNFDLPFQSKVVGFYNSLLNNYNNKLVKPGGRIVQDFKAEVGRQQQKVKLMNGDPDKPLTISAGMGALLAAVKARSKKEWETRVMPTIQKMRGKTTATAEDVVDVTETKEDDDEFYDDAE